MILRLILAILFLPSLLYAGQGMGPGPGFMTYSAGGGALDCTGWTLCESFEGTGAPASVITSSGTPNYDATPPVTMEGSQALLLDGYTDSVDTRVTLGITDTVGQDNSFFKGQLLITAKGTASGSDNIITWYDGATQICIVSVADTGETTYQIRTQGNSGTLVTVSDTLNLGTAYYVYARLIEGTADNAQCSVAVNTVDSEPTSGTAYANSTGGLSEGSLDRITVWGDYTAETDRWDVYWGFVQAKGNQ